VMGGTLQIDIIGTYLFILWSDCTVLAVQARAPPTILEYKRQNAHFCQFGGYIFLILIC
jgi:hypothetical protein